MKFLLYVGLSLSVFAIHSCNQAGNSSDSRPDGQSASNDSVITLQGLNVPLYISINRELIESEGLNSLYNPMLGQIEINCGDRIQLRISEESLSLQELKTELEEDQLFKYKFEEESASELIYLTILPDGTELSYQYMKLINLGGRNFLVRSEPMGEYTLQNIESMKAIVATLGAEEI